MSTLIEQSDEFLKKHMRQALQGISVPALGIGRDPGVDSMERARDVFA